MRTTSRLTTLVALPLAALSLAGEAAAQEDPQEDVPMVEGFDPGRAMLNDSRFFDPFRPEPDQLEPLADALADGRVEEETPVLVLSRGDADLALLTMQMTYHHVAQGELDGEPWMVTF